MKIYHITLILLLSLHTLSFADERFEKVDSMFQELNSTHTPGAAIAIIQDDEIIYQNAYGMASLELGVPNTIRTVFRLGSVSKQFTAACIAMLALENKLSLDDPLMKYFPELPADVYGAVKIRHLVHHTSGIRDAEAMYPLMGINYSQWYTHEMMLGMLARQQALDFEPGTKMEYSNSAYTLMALIVEKVSGMKFHEFAKERIFSPLGMNSTMIQTSHSTFIPNRAAGYQVKSGKYINWMTNNQLVGHDAVYSTIEDMFKWEQAFFNGKLDAEIIKMITMPGTFNDGALHSYAFGLAVHKYRGLKIYSHSGWYVGYTAFFVIFPDQRFSIICLSNLGDYSPKHTSFRIANIFLADQIAKVQNTDEYKKEIAATIFTKKLKRKRAGKYVGIDFGRYLTFKFKDNNLYNKSPEYVFEPSPYSAKELINHERDVSLRIQPETINTKEILLERISGAYGSYGRYKTFTEIPLNDGEYSDFTGKYFDDELENTSEITYENGALKIRISDMSSDLTQFEPDQFAANWAKISFMRNENGDVTGFLLSRYGVQGIIFKRID